MDFLGYMKYVEFWISKIFCYTKLLIQEKIVKLKIQFTTAKIDFARIDYMKKEREGEGETLHLARHLRSRIEHKTSCWDRRLNSLTIKNTRGTRTSRSVTSFARVACNLWRDLLHRGRRSPTKELRILWLSFKSLVESRCRYNDPRHVWVAAAVFDSPTHTADINNPTITRGRNVRNMKHRITEVVQASPKSDITTTTA